MASSPSLRLVWLCSVQNCVCCASPPPLSYSVCWRRQCQLSTVDARARFCGRLRLAFYFGGFGIVSADGERERKRPVFRNGILCIDRVFNFFFSVALYLVCWMLCIQSIHTYRFNITQHININTSKSNFQCQKERIVLCFASEMQFFVVVVVLELRTTAKGSAKKLITQIVMVNEEGDGRIVR